MLRSSFPRAIPATTLSLTTLAVLAVVTAFTAAPQLDRAMADAANSAIFPAWSSPLGATQAAQIASDLPSSTPRIIDDGAISKLPPEMELLDQVVNFESATRREI